MKIPPSSQSLSRCFASSLFGTTPEPKLDRAQGTKTRTTAPEDTSQQSHRAGGGRRGATRVTRPKLTGERGLELAGGGRRDATVEEDCVDVDRLDPAAARAVYHGVAVLADYLHGGFLSSESEEGAVAAPRAVSLQ